MFSFCFIAPSILQAQQQALQQQRAMFERRRAELQPYIAEGKTNVAFLAALLRQGEAAAHANCINCGAPHEPVVCRYCGTRA